MPYITERVRAEMGIGDDEKFCPHCKQVKKKSEFQRNNAHADGLQNYCKVCQNAINAQNRREVALIRQRYGLRARGV